MPADSGQLFLIDTGPRIYIVGKKSGKRHQLASYKLRVARIAHQYLWHGAEAFKSRQLLGVRLDLLHCRRLKHHYWADFLTHFNLLVDTTLSRLTETNIGSFISRTNSYHVYDKISSIPWSVPYVTLLQGFSDAIDLQ